jgi:hypothetical protein
VPELPKESAHASIHGFHVKFFIDVHIENFLWMQNFKKQATQKAHNSKITAGMVESFQINCPHQLGSRLAKE